MELLSGLYHNFLQFFSWPELSFIFSGTGLLVIVNLVLSEGLLSFDNALVLAVLVSHLPRDRFYRLGPFHISIQQWALTAGLFGAYLFRALAIILGTYLIRFWFLQLVGGSYLLWLAYEHFFVRDQGESAVKAYGKGFWPTVLKVEIMDIAFSIDSILAALGISKRVWAILLGGMLGILCMRLVAGVFVGLIKKFPLLRHTGYGLVFLIGFRLCSEVHWLHFAKFFDYIGPGGAGTLILFAVVIWGTARVREQRLKAVQGLILLVAGVLLFSWSGTRLRLQMSDLVFSIVMLTTFASTFLLNPLYVRRQTRALAQDGPSLGPGPSSGDGQQHGPEHQEGANRGENRTGCRDKG